MNRKTKVGIGVAFVALAAGLTCFLWPPAEEPVRVTFFGPSRKQPAMMIFSILNKSTNRLRPLVGFRILTNGYWSYGNAGAEGFFQELEPQCSTPIETAVMSTNRWRVVLRYSDPTTYSALDRVRFKAAEYALRHGWMRTTRWLVPLNTVKRIFGPEMFGNKPAPPEQK